MNGICDICKQPNAGIMFDVINDKGKKKQIQICFNCVLKRADEIIRGKDGDVNEQEKED